MTQTPLRSSLVNETEKVILAGIRQQRWRLNLPGERILALELRVSRWTVRAALDSLKQKGVLTIEHGRRCQITNSALRAKKKTSRSVAILVPLALSKLHSFSALWIDELREILSQKGISLAIHESIRAYGKSPDAVLNHFISRHHHSDWILFQSTHAMQRWFQARSLPTIIAGTRFAGIELPAVDIDSHATSVHLGHTLIGFGHHRLALLRPQSPTAGDLGIEDRLQSYLTDFTHRGVSLAIQTCDQQIESVCQAIDRCIRTHPPPTVFICTRSTYVATAFSHLARCGFKVPDDFSLISIEWEPFLDLVVPRIAHYTISPQKFAKQVARQIDAHSPFKEPINMSPQFIKGGSLRRITA